MKTTNEKHTNIKQKNKQPTHNLNQQQQKININSKHQRKQNTHNGTTTITKQ